MLRTSYSLQSLLMIREKKREQSINHFSHAMRVLKHEETTLHQLQNKLCSLQQTAQKRRENYFERIGSGSVNVGQLRYMESHMQALKHLSEQAALSVKQQEDIKQLAQKNLQHAQHLLIKAEQDVKVIEKHKGKWQAIYHREQQRKEEECLDEIAQRGV